MAIWIIAGIMLVCVRSFLTLLRIMHHLISACRKFNADSKFKADREADEVEDEAQGKAKENLLESGEM